ncbi:molybdate ABC transporter substrate-binding protein [Deinococcus peraridilitoris]|uniref:Molybdenum ABC transporter, periplasmic molybdate-binding protein n=1 Tax=Deinococcus peraridilitoris (strain DSM 19664 / LMG 22246 / CIP 109416 / KR-200) TaxID=937777 RepID=L0A4T2_DEIPD|nr:molybdate ABC transporter substrate-binding protein [Deinococcus peraridilitoris]AFZ68025.1 molybdenum ABC transporter, periplasmic molybdate-binding protein [Deinococcus peraridilitoris DSM 19664]
MRTVIPSVLLALTIGSAHAETARVAAASDLKFVLDELAAQYRAAFPKADPLLISYGSSGNFYAQIQNGAPFTLYLSADSSYPAKLEQAGLTVRGTRRDYAIGRLVIWVPKNSPLDVARLGPRALSDPRVRKVAIANPEHAPYGAAALTLLDHHRIGKALKGKFVVGENIAQAAQYASTAADAGILALSIVKAPAFEALGGTYWLAPLSHHLRLRQQMVIVRDGQNTRQFWGFLLSPAARELFRKYGFVLPREQ